jgi:hypothetical protein
MRHKATFRTRTHPFVLNTQSNQINMFTLASTTMTARPALRARVTKRETTKRIIVPKSTANSQSVQRMAPVKVRD